MSKQLDLTDEEVTFLHLLLQQTNFPGKVIQLAASIQTKVKDLLEVKKD